MVYEDRGQDANDGPWFVRYAKLVEADAPQEAPFAVAPTAGPGSLLYDRLAPTSTAGIAAIAAAREEGEALLTFLRDFTLSAPAASDVA